MDFLKKHLFNIILTNTTFLHLSLSLDLEYNYLNPYRMKTKNYLIAAAIFGGMLFTAYAANSIEQDEQQTAKIQRSAIRVPTHG